MKTSTIQVGDVDVQMLCEGDAIMRMMVNGKLWEPETREIWGVLVDPARCVIDIGAYTGVYAIASALMGAKVVALEPHPANYARLRQNAALNGVQMEMLQVAASDRCTLVLLRTKHGAERLSDTASLVDPWPHTVAVGAVRIDGLALPEWVGLIKIDAEHHEANILEGARNTIMDLRPLVLVECLNGNAASEVDALMAQMGYAARMVLDNRNRLYGGEDGRVVR